MKKTNQIVKDYYDIRIPSLSLLKRFRNRVLENKKNEDFQLPMLVNNKRSKSEIKSSKHILNKQMFHKTIELNQEKFKEKLNSPSECNLNFQLLAKNRKRINLSHLNTQMSDSKNKSKNSNDLDYIEHLNNLTFEIHDFVHLQKMIFKNQNEILKEYLYLKEYKRDITTYDHSFALNSHLLESFSIHVPFLENFEKEFSIINQQINCGKIVKADNSEIKYEKRKIKIKDLNPTLIEEKNNESSSKKLILKSITFQNYFSVIEIKERANMNEIYLITSHSFKVFRIELEKNLFPEIQNEDFQKLVNYLYFEQKNNRKKLVYNENERMIIIKDYYGDFHYFKIQKLLINSNYPEYHWFMVQKDDNIEGGWSFLSKLDIFLIPIDLFFHNVF